ncbi:MFS transporter [Thiomicrospira sp. WB1]|uniref:MFS transporter n=1 Tax=Thiomicrospira sp. WB1 TaxID=1685380 RepID=UPI000749974F|nr:MFS transporter [Thiomicrospira sp. WB1]KUJ71903.1 MFS transporter [Thiomicrospira sp. WB1]
MSQSAPFYRQAYPKLSAFYLVYFMLFGALIPYISLYYQSLSFSAIEIGQLMAVFIGTKIVAPNLLGWLADRMYGPIVWLRVCGLLTALFSLGWLVTQSYWGLLLTVFGFSFFFHAALPLFEAYTFSVLHGQKALYGRVRLWGSIGFILAVLWGGWQLDWLSEASLPWLLVSLAWGIWLATFWVRADHAVSQSHHVTEGFVRVLKRPWVWSLLLVSGLIQFSHGTYYSFYSIFLTDFGYSKTLVAWLWAIGVIAEIAVFFWMRPLFARHSVRALLLLSLVLTAIRWAMIPLVPDSLGLLVVAQTLHAASYGLFHAAAIYLIDHYFIGPNQSRGQALYASFSHGLGGALGMLVAGYSWEWSGAMLSFMISLVAVLLALVIALRWVREPVLTRPG